MSLFLMPQSGGAETYFYNDKDDLVYDKKSYTFSKEYYINHIFKSSRNGTEARQIN